MTDYGLSTQQLAVICALSCGANMTAAAEQGGVHRNTIANWRRNSLPFQQGFAHAQYDRALYYREKLEDLIDLAVKSLQEILADPKAPPSVKLKAALAVIGMAATPPSPKKQVELDIEKIVVSKAPPRTVTEEQLAPPPPPPVHKDAQPAPPADTPGVPKNAHPAPSAHNPAQTYQPVTPKIANPKVGRNEACPCGSGKKYKRCCLNPKVSLEFVQKLACHVMPNEL